eukprot:Filipodium_phascolosomae@DN2428_c0_g1_i13.p2
MSYKTFISAAANVLVTSSGEVYLSDFGTTRQIAKSIDTISGSPYWMAPEICKLQFDTSSPAYDCKADMWSLGVTAIELVTGKPFTTVTNDLGSRGVHYIMLKVSSCQVGLRRKDNARRAGHNRAT